MSGVIDAEALRLAQDVTHRVARTFSLAIRFLPPGLRADVYLLYLVCRTLDDLVDTAQPDAGSRVEQVAAWASGAAPPAGREEIILDDLCTRYADMPRDAIVDFCTGQLEELRGVRVETEDDLDLHAYRVAGTVGRLMAGLLGVRDPEAGRAAVALGIAMQRTNILRDIDEDLARGRVYIPTTALQRAGVHNLKQDSRDRLLRDQIAIADRWYDEGLAGIAHLRQGGRSVRAAALMYREILREIERDGLGRSRPRRVSVSAPRKLWLVARAFAL